MKKSQIKDLSRLYRRRISPEMPATLTLAREMAQLSLELKKPLSVLIDRRGRIVTVSVSLSHETPLPPRFGEADRLYGLRLLHTRPQGNGFKGKGFKDSSFKDKGFREQDLSMLFLNRLDAMIVFSAFYNKKDSVEIGDAHLAHLAPPTSSEEDWIVLQPQSMRELENIPMLELIRSLEEEMRTQKAARAVKRSSQERAILVGVNTGESPHESDARLQELTELAKSAGAIVAYQSQQHRTSLDPKTLIGAGKLQEIVSKAYHEDADLLIFDRELSPAQARDIGAATQLKVLDRTQVILDIFAQNAKGREAQVQVALAQLNYQLTRLTGKGQAMSRLGGGIGTRGPGETKLEIDRRRIRDRITALEAEVDSISQHRSRGRQQRIKDNAAVVALVGYTNAGKSTLFNQLAKADVLSKNQLFATLRPTTREGWLPALGEWGGKVIYTDTVGFIRDLPDTLINAFRATLEELHDADILLHVVDASAPEMAGHIDAVNRILDTLNIQVPRHIVLNKSDAVTADLLDIYAHRYNTQWVSAQTGEGIAPLKTSLATWIEGFLDSVVPQEEQSLATSW